MSTETKVKNVETKVENVEFDIKDEDDIKREIEVKESKKKEYEQKILELKENIKKLESSSANEADKLDSEYKNSTNNIVCLSIRFSVETRDSKDIKSFHKRIDEEYNIQVKNLTKTKEQTIASLKQKDEICGTSVNIDTHPKIKKINKQLDKIKTKYEDDKKYVSEVFAKLDEVKKSIMDYNRGGNGQKELNEMNSQLVKFKKFISIIEEDIQRLKWWNKYIEYAKDYQVDFETEDELFGNCNKSWNYHLISAGYDTTESCPYPMDDYECDGWVTNEKRCKCGSFKGFYWNSEGVEKESLEFFNIESEVPYGYRDRQW